MPLSSSARNTMLDALSVTHVSLHTADPGDTGANEVTGGTYARQAITMAGASGGSRAASDQPVFSVPAGATINFVGFWSSATAGTFFGSDDVISESFGAAGNYTLTSASLSVS